jgi:Ca2+-binding RTX toxin-like protein
MSEIVTTPPGGIFREFGLEVISQGPVTLRRFPSSAPGINEALGSPEDDTITAISSSTGFHIEGRDGDDDIRGGGRADRIFADNGQDTVDGGAGNDVIYGGDATDLIFGGRGDDTIFGDNGNEDTYGSDDTIFGGEGNDVIYGGTGDDLVFGGRGNDQIYGGFGDDTIIGGQGNDTLWGEDGDDDILGGAGNDVIVGGSGDDYIDSGRGNDLVIGGAGNDTLIGGAGRDRFQIGPDSGLDEISDFNAADDTILLAQSLLPGSGLNLGQLDPRDFRAVDRINGSENAKIVYERATGLIYYNPVSGTDVPLLKIGQNLPLAASDFQIING